MSEAAGVIQGALTIGSELTEVSKARDWISALAHQADLSTQESYELQLALSEACTNAIVHGYGMAKGHVVELTAQIDNDQIYLTIRDFGSKIDLDGYQEPDLQDPSESGYGIYLLRSLMHEVQFDTSQDQGTQVTLLKYRPSARPERDSS